jgi:hypothetical protein
VVERRPVDVVLAEQGLDREHARAAVRARTRHPAHLGEGRGACLDGVDDRGVVDDPAVADDHVVLLRRCGRPSVDEGSLT